MEELRKQLKISFATVFAFYLKAHYFHWNVEGSSFYEYHKMFDDIVGDVYGSIDPFAEHIRTLNTYTPGSFSRLSELSLVKDQLAVPSAHDMLKELHADNTTVIENLTLTFLEAEKQNLQGLMNFLADRIDQHNKWSWFLRASQK